MMEDIYLRFVRKFPRVYVSEEAFMLALSKVEGELKSIEVSEPDYRTFEVELSNRISLDMSCTVILVGDNRVELPVKFLETDTFVVKESL